MKECLKNSWVLGLILLAGLHLNLEGRAEAEEKVLTIADFSPVVTMDPAATTSAQHIMFFRNIFQGLLRYKFNSAEIEGDLASRWTISDDGLVYNFKLRDNIHFHKEFGRVTAQDVKFSFDRVMDPQTRSPYSGELKADIKEVKVIDPSTVAFHLKTRSTPFLHKLTRPRPVSIVSQKAVEKFGKEFARNPIGSGPFIFQSMTREQIIVVANKDYWEGPPKIDKVIFKSVPDMDTLLMALQKGEVDIAWILPREKAVYDRLKAIGMRVKNIDRGIWVSIFLNPHQFKPFADFRVRAAMAHAIDRDAVNEHVLAGTAVKLNSLVPQGYFGHTEEGLRQYPYDLQKAKSLLAEAGYPNGFEVTDDTFPSGVYLPLSTALQGQFEKVGIKVKLDVTDQPAFLKKISSGSPQMNLFQTTRSPDADSILTQFFHTAGHPPGQNVPRYNKLDKEIDEARAELDSNKRLKMYQVIQKKLMEDLPAIPLFMVGYPAAYWPYVGGLPDRDPLWALDFYNFHFVGKKEK